MRQRCAGRLVSGLVRPSSRSLDFLVAGHCVVDGCVELVWNNVADDLGVGGLDDGGMTFDRLGGSFLDLGSLSFGGGLGRLLGLGWLHELARLAEYTSELAGKRGLFTLDLRSGSLVVGRLWVLLLAATEGAKERCATLLTSLTLILGLCRGNWCLSCGLGSGTVSDGGGGKRVLGSLFGCLFLLGFFLLLFLLGLSLLDEAQEAVLLLRLGGAGGLGRGDSGSLLGWLFSRGGDGLSSRGLDVVSWCSDRCSIDGLVLDGLIQLGRRLRDRWDFFLASSGRSESLLLGLLGGRAGDTLLAEEAAEDRGTLVLLFSRGGCGLVLLLFFLFLFLLCGSDGSGWCW